MVRDLGKLKSIVKNLKRDFHILYLVYHHQETPWYARVFSLVIVAYGLSPVDLIPDFIPVLGYLDDAILLPLGVLGAFKMIPKNVLEECRKLASSSNNVLRKNWVAGGMIILVWVALIFWIIFKFK